jgi:hypothetical protein
MRHAWQRQEGTLDTEGARRVPGSGGGVRKGDNMGKTYLVSCKATQAKSFSLKLADIVKCDKDAKTEQRQPVMQVSLYATTGPQTAPLAVIAVMPWRDFIDLL